MASNNGQRVAAFLLAALFLFSTIGATAYVVYSINNQDAGLVSETPEEKAAAEALAQQQALEEQQVDGEQACGQGPVTATDPRPIPQTTTATVPVSALEKIDIKVGEGEEVQPSDCVVALYYGTLASNGTKFDGNYENGQPIEFSLDGVIEGWTAGIPGMKVGGVRRLVIPAAQAYGEQERTGIPANSDLIFEVEILSTRRAGA